MLNPIKHQFRQLHRTISKCHENPLGLPLKGSKTPPTLPRNKPIGKQPVANVKSIIAVSSAKGGVGKSTCSANLAISFQHLGLKVGLLDADLFGPSVPRLMNTEGEPRLNEKGFMQPLVNYGIHTISMGNLIPDSKALAWRGMMVMKSLQQLIYQTAWPKLDLLVIDMPPGTGDTQLTIGQLVPLDGAILISTPQDLALIDVRRGAQLFEKVEVKLLGLIENMAHFNCPCCHTKTSLFGNESNLKTMCQEIGLDILGSLPLVPEVAHLSDRGTPVTVINPEHQVSLLYKEMAQKVLQKIKKD